MHLKHLCKNNSFPSHYNAMKEDCFISKIEASQDGSPYDYVAFSDPSDYKPGAQKATEAFWSKHDCIYFPIGHDEEFAKSNGIYLGPWVYVWSR